MLSRKGGPAGQPKTGQYSVDVAAFEQLALPTLADDDDPSTVYILDEIGRMELHSSAFASRVEALLERGVRLLGAITAPIYGLTRSYAAFALAAAHETRVPVCVLVRRAVSCEMDLSRLAVIAIDHQASMYRGGFAHCCSTVLDSPIAVLQTSERVLACRECSGHRVQFCDQVSACPGVAVHKLTAKVPLLPKMCLAMPGISSNRTCVCCAQVRDDVVEEVSMNVVSRWLQGGRDKRQRR